MKTTSKKAKGRYLQNWTRDIILHEHPSLEEDDVRSTSMGVSGVDIQLSPAAKKLVPFAIECKNRANMTVYKDYEQAVRNCTKETIPIAVLKANRKKPLVVCDAEWFFKNFPKRTRK